MMHIEKRDDAEYLIGAPEDEGECRAMHDGWTCCHHVDGQHVATYRADPCGEKKIVDRWPIEAAPSDPFALGVLDGLRRVEGAMRDLDARPGIGGERKFELLAECISEEIADVNDAIANRIRVRGAI